MKMRKMIIVAGHPKSGITWMIRLLCDTLRFMAHYSGDLKKDDICSDVNHQLQGLKGDYMLLKQHTMPGNLPENTSHCVYMIRDVRDVLTSWYFWHHPLNSVNFNSSQFNEFILSQLQDKRTFGSWQNHIKTWYESYTELSAKMPVIFMKYEDILADTYSHLIKLIKTLKFEMPEDEHIKKAIHRQSFSQRIKHYENLPAGTPVPGGIGAQKLFLRKGIAGDWINWFDDQSKETVKQYAGETLIKLGYVKDNNW